MNQHCAMKKYLSQKSFLKNLICYISFFAKKMILEIGSTKSNSAKKKVLRDYTQN